MCQKSKRVAKIRLGKIQLKIRKDIVLLPINKKPDWLMCQKSKGLSKFCLGKIFPTGKLEK